MVGMIAIRMLAGIDLLGATTCASNTVSSQTYNPPAVIQAAATPKIAAVLSFRQRKEAPNRIATIMGGYGNRLKTLDTAQPVKDEVADAFMKGLRARGLKSGGGEPLRLALTNRKFDADMIMGSTARIDRTASVMDSTSAFALFKTGVFADIADLQRRCQVVLDRTVDNVLDASAFRAALGPAGV